MMRWLFVASLVVASCTSFSGSNAPSDTPLGDGGVATPPPDAAVQPPDAGTCLTLTDKPAPSDSNWLFLDDAVQLDGGAVQLTAPRTSQKGAVWRKLPYPAPKVTVSVTLGLDNVSANTADGFGIGWAPDLGAGQPPPGGKGPLMDLCGNGNGVDAGIIPNGFAVALVTYMPNAPGRYLGLFDLGKDACGARDNHLQLDASIAASMPVNLVVADGVVSGDVNAMTLTAPVPNVPIGWVGIGAGTQSAYAQQTVTNIVIVACY